MPRVLCPLCKLREEQLRTSNPPTDDSSETVIWFDVSSDAVCSICLEANSELLPSDNGTWLCPSCIVDCEDEAITEPMPLVFEINRASRVTACENCGRIHPELLQSPNGQLLCPTCILELDEESNTEVVDFELPSSLTSFEGQQS